MSELTPNQTTDFILYTTPNGKVKLKVVLLNSTLWLTQKNISELFGVTVPTINEHLKNIFKTNELDENSVIRKFLTTANDGKNYKTNFYNLDAIISVGYRVNSIQATQFRIWATQTLKEYIIKGFVLDDERLKQGDAIFGKDHFKELLERVRSIRASERRIYLQITDIFRECAEDYNVNSEITKNFYAMVQNKFHFAITGKTAAEIVYLKADSKKENMGLTTWKNAPDGRVIKSDVKVAKNYLQEKEVKQLERTVTGYFDYIENLIERRNLFTMRELAESINKFLNFNEYKILPNLGTVSHIKAISKASKEYDKFNKTQKIVSDFDKQIKLLKGSKK